MNAGGHHRHRRRQPRGHRARGLLAGSTSRAARASAPITHFDASAFPVRIGGEVKGFDPMPVVAAVSQTRRQPRPQGAARPGRRRGGDRRCEPCRPICATRSLCVGVGLETHLPGGPDRRSPAAGLTSAWSHRSGSRSRQHRRPLLQTPLDRTTRLLGDRYGFPAGRYTNCSACAAGAQVVGEAWQMLRRDKPSVALAGATDSMLNPLGLGGFSLLRVLSAENDRPQRACRPFDATRQGTVLGEGAAFLVLETLEHARRRGGTHLCRGAGLRQFHGRLRRLRSRSRRPRRGARA